MAELEALARDAFSRIPEPFAGYLEDIAIRVEDFADAATLDDLGICDPWALTGVYQGHPASERSVWFAGELPPVITLFRMPLLGEWIETDVSFEDLITHVVVHEVGHHFGLSDDHMHELEHSPLRPQPEPARPGAVTAIFGRRRLPR